MTTRKTDDKREIEKIITCARSVKVSVSKNSIPGGGSLQDKLVVYMVYKIGDLEVSDNIVSYKGRIFPDSKITSMIKKRATELNPDVVARCQREAEEWTHTSIAIHKKTENQR